MSSGPAPDRTAFESLYRARFGGFLRVATAIAGDVERGRDAVHEGFARAIRHRLEYRGEGSLEAWVWPAVLNAARKGRPREGPLLSVEEVPAAASAANGAPRSDSDLRERIAALPERQRLTLFLRYYADLDYAAISQILGISSGTVGATIHAAHATLRRALEEVARD